MPTDFLKVLTVLGVIIFAIIIASILKYFSSKRDPSFLLKKKPKHLMDLKTKLLPNEVITIIIDDVSPKLGYKVESFDVEKGNVILSSSSPSTWGFFYPIYITSQDDICAVEIGIKSKLIQGGPIGGPLRTRQHKKCFHAIKSALTNKK